MISCPNCSKKFNETFEYCNECGSSLKGGEVGDFKTSITNVFTNCDEFLYLFAKNGHQIILKADSLDNLKEMVLNNNMFWMGDDFKIVRKATGKVRKISNPFLEISAMAKLPKTDMNFSNSKQKYSSDFKKKTNHVKVKRKDYCSISKPKRNSNLKKVLSVEDLPREYGILGVSKEYKNGSLLWTYQSTKLKSKIHENTLIRLKNRVESKNLSWHVTDYEKSVKAFDDDKIETERKDNEIRLKNLKFNLLDVKTKSNIRKSCSNAVSVTGNNTELEKFFR